MSEPATQRSLQVTDLPRLSIPPQRQAEQMRELRLVLLLYLMDRYGQDFVFEGQDLDTTGIEAVADWAVTKGWLDLSASAHLRKGVASHLLEHLLALARSRGYRRVLLETGSGPAFEPALALYRRHGFEAGQVFGDYRPSDFNQFLQLDLSAP